MQKIMVFIRAYAGVFLIGLAFAVSAIIVFTRDQGWEEERYISRDGDSIASIAKTYQTTVQKIIDENYPDLSENEILRPGTRVRIPHGQSAKRITTVLIAHWQLEPGVRDALEYFGKEYQKLYPNVRIVQNAVPETTYPQWFTTQMLGSTPPDLIEIGKVAYPLLVSYYMRYFVPMTEYATRPNPYNKGNEFEHTALRETVKDGLRACYIPEVQEYMSIALTQVLMRMYYNKTLLMKLTGRTNAPADWREFLAACNEIKQYRFHDRKAARDIERLKKDISVIEQRITAGRNGAPTGTALSALTDEIAKKKAAIDEIEKRSPQYVPIASSQFHIGMAEGRLFNVVTSKARNILDYNHDCLVSSVESYIGFKSGAIDLNNPAYRAKFAMAAAYASNCMPGFTGLNRDDAVFSFVQQRAVFIPTGTWDAQTLDGQARDNGFEIAVMDFPIPRTDDPEYGKFIEGPMYEEPITAFAFGCPTPDTAPERRKAAIDFLLFLSSKDNNIQFNKIIGWLPYVKGAEGSGILEQFKISSDGVTSGVNLNIGGESLIKWQQLYSMYYGLAMPFEKMRDEFQPYYIERGYRDYLQVNKNWRRSLIVDEKNLATLRAKAFLAPNSAQRDEYFQKYRNVLLRPVTREIDTSYERMLITAANDGVKIPDAYERTASIGSHHK